MKVCIETHLNPAFGEIPTGSLWEDNSPYVKANPRKFKLVKDDKEEVDDDSPVLG